MKRFAALFLVGTIPAALFADPVAHLVMVSDPGEWVGQGQSWDVTYTPSNTILFEAQLDSWAPGPGPNSASFSFFGDGSWPINVFSQLLFTTNQLGVPIQNGFYPIAQRAPFHDPGFAGLDVNWQHRGLNELVGSFTIHDFAFSGTEGSYVIDRFDASFEQRSGFN
ncbi:MAG TPA: hypothetical protein VK171_13405 [Fimbriimonas sp.]|nr:hypothetical protein [Fimbriimonas sp.]